MLVPNEQTWGAMGSIVTLRLHPNNTICLTSLIYCLGVYKMPNRFVHIDPSTYCHPVSTLHIISKPRQSSVPCSFGVRTFKIQHMHTPIAPAAAERWLGCSHQTGRRTNSAGSQPFVLYSPPLHSVPVAAGACPCPSLGQMYRSSPACLVGGMVCQRVRLHQLMCWLYQT